MGTSHAFSPHACAEAVGDRVRLAYFVSHPIQYQTPFLRLVAQEPTIDLTVFFGSDFSVKGYRDEGFGVDVRWDTPQLQGYRFEFLPTLRDKGTEGTFTPINHGILSRLRGGNGVLPFDVVWLHGYSTLNQLHILLVARLLNIPVLLRSDSSLHDRPRSGLKLAAKKLFFTVLAHFVDAILVSGTWNMDYWRHYLGKDFPFFLLPYAVDNEWFQQRCALASETRSTLQSELKLEPGRQVILFASKLQTRKHCNDLIEAYSRLLDEPLQSAEPYLVIVGDGEERLALEQQARDTGLPGIRFCGFRNQSELPRFFDLATVFVLPARHEPWGLVVNEVMNAGRPVIVTDEVGCHPDLITHGVEGFVYPARDVAALKQALRTILSDEALEASMGQAALQRISRWSFDQDLRGLNQALARVTRNHPSLAIQKEPA